MTREQFGSDRTDMSPVRQQRIMRSESPTSDIVKQGGQHRFPDLMTEAELIEYLRIPSVTKAENPHGVVEHLKRFRGLPRIHICNKALYPKKAIQEWIERQTSHGDQ